MSVLLSRLVILGRISFQERLQTRPQASHQYGKHIPLQSPKKAGNSRPLRVPLLPAWKGQDARHLHWVLAMELDSAAFQLSLIYLDRWQTFTHLERVKLHTWICCWYLDSAKK